MGIKASCQVSILDITDAYSVTLTSEAYTFVGNTSGAPSGLSCTTQAVAYCGTQQCSKVSISTITCPTGISATITDNNTVSPTITFKTTATVTAACEATIPIVVDGITINKKFSFAVAKRGEDGVSVKSMIRYYLLSDGMPEKPIVYDGESINVMSVKESGLNKRISGNGNIVDYNGTFVCEPVPIDLSKTCPVVLKGFSTVVYPAKLTFLDANQSPIATYSMTYFKASDTEFTKDLAELVGVAGTGGTATVDRVAYVQFSPTIYTNGQTAITMADLSNMEIYMPVYGVGVPWSPVEPAYEPGSTKSLYYIDHVKFSDGSSYISDVSKSASYDGLNTKVDMSDITGYVTSRGENLVTNGTCLLGDNTNFSSFTYDGSDTYYSGGCFKKVSDGQTDEYIPVDVSQKYELSYYVKTAFADMRTYDYVGMFDIDKNSIHANHVLWIEGSTTTLAKDLKDGDTVVYLTSAAGFDSSMTKSYKCGFIVWNYTNSKGYTYEPETYSRNVYSGLWTDGTTAIDKTNNTITLTSAWSNGTIPAGTSLSQCNSGGTYVYLNINYTCNANEWTHKVGTIEGVARNQDSAYHAIKRFREGTAFVKIGWLLDFNESYTDDRITKLSTITFTKNANKADIISSVDVEYYLSTSSTSLSGGSWSTTAPTWVNGKYMWSRTVTTYGNSNKTYSPSQNGVCIAGATGATGTSVSSITTEFYLSTSKTTQTDGSWVTTMPTWSNGKYLWTRSKIVYTNPSSTVYTTPICDSSWEAVNDVEVGGRNLIANSSDIFLSSSDYPSASTREKGKVTVAADTAFNAYEYIDTYVDVADIANSEGSVYTFSAEVKATNLTKSGVYLQFDLRVTTSEPVVIAKTEIKPDVSGWQKLSAKMTLPKFEQNPTKSLIILYSNTEGLSGVVFEYRNFKFEKGDKATDWTPAPEDVDDKIDLVQDSANSANAATNDRVAKTETLIQALSDSISMLVVDDNGQSLMTQTETGWEFSMKSTNEAVTKLQDNLSSLQNDTNDTNATIDTLKQAVADYGETLEYVNITTYEDEPCIELGESDSDFKLMITNTRIMFMNGSNVPTYINTYGLVTQNIEVTGEIAQGGFVMLNTADGGWGLLWKGANS